jgi:bifunctional DNA-binding transcriptional regulator/antitoxin component of YhaV-PrlF toxin-antitoxin module
MGKSKKYKDDDDKTPSFVVVARSDGRGGIKPFGTYGKGQAGSTVQIGDIKYKVTSDGRVNIPKAVMNKFGTDNKEGRKVLQIDFRTQKTGEKDYWKDVKSMITRPAPENVEKETGDKTKIHGPDKEEDELLPSDTDDFYPLT